MIISLLDSVLKLQEIYSISAGRNMKGSSRTILSTEWEEKYAVASHLLFTLCFNKMRPSGSSHLQGLALSKAFKLKIIHVSF